MGAFILAGVVFIVSTALAFLVGFAQGMATAPHYDNTPIYIFVGGIILAVAIALTHYIHLGW